MKFYDLRVNPENLGEIVKKAKVLGWSGLGVIFEWKGLKELEKAKKEIEKYKKEIDIVLGVGIKTRKPGEIKEIAKKIRKRVELILVFGGDLKINRKAVEIREVDILANPENEENSGLNHVMVKLAAENNVAIEFSFRKILHSFGKTRAENFNKFLTNAKLVRKYKAPFLITSSAISQWDLRSPFDLLSFGKVLGFQDKEVKEALSDKIVKENRKRLSEKWIMPGVEIE